LQALKAYTEVLTAQGMCQDVIQEKILDLMREVNAKAKEG